MYLRPLQTKVTFPGIVNGRALCVKWAVRVHLMLDDSSLQPETVLRRVLPRTRFQAVSDLFSLFFSAALSTLPLDHSADVRAPREFVVSTRVSGVSMLSCDSSVRTVLAGVRLVCFLFFCWLNVCRIDTFRQLSLFMIAQMAKDYPQG